MTADAKILSVLREAGTSGVAPAALATKTGQTAKTIAGRISELQRLGYEIESTPHLGYRLVGEPDVLNADDLLSRLPSPRIIGRDVQVFQQTSSTNDIVEKLARDGVSEGIVVFAETQTKGRGRLGRKWVSPAGQGLWFSVLLRPSLPPGSVTQLTIAAATAVARAIHKQTALTPQIKWPNDILLSGKKAVGILTELNAEIDSVRYAILGIGVDVNVTDFPPELAEIATSLAAAAGRRFVRAEIAAAILSELDADYARVARGDFAALAEEWEEQCITLGQRVEIHIGARTITGRAESLDTDGALLLRTDHGRLERIVGGDVMLEK